jgi:hypothetical protein
MMLLMLIAAVRESREWLPSPPFASCQEYRRKWATTAFVVHLKWALQDQHFSHGTGKNDENKLALAQNVAPGSTPAVDAITQSIIDAIAKLPESERAAILERLRDIGRHR